MYFDHLYSFIAELSADPSRIEGKVNGVAGLGVAYARMLAAAKAPQAAERSDFLPST